MSVYTGPFCRGYTLIEEVVFFLVCVILATKWHYDVQRAAKNVS
jgi:hypothetical protein